MSKAHFVGHSSFAYRLSRGCSRGLHRLGELPDEEEGRRRRWRFFLRHVPRTGGGRRVMSPAVPVRTIRPRGLLLVPDPHRCVYLSRSSACPSRPGPPAKEKGTLLPIHVILCAVAVSVAFDHACCFSQIQFRDSWRDRATFSSQIIQPALLVPRSAPLSAGVARRIETTPRRALRVHPALPRHSVR